MDMLRMRAAAELLGIPYPTVAKYAKEFPFLRWQVPDGRIEFLLPAVLLPYITLIRQACAAGLNAEEVGRLLTVANCSEAFMHWTYPTRLSFWPASGEAARGMVTLENIAQITPDEAVRLESEDRPAAIFFDLRGIVARVDEALEGVEIDGEDRLRLGGEWAVMAEAALSKAWRQWYATEAEEGTA